MILPTMERKLRKKVCLSNDALFYFQKEKTARQVWTPQSKFEGVRRIMVYFLKNDGTPATPTGSTPQASNVPAGGAAQASNTPAASAPAPASAPDAKEPPAAAK